MHQWCFAIGVSSVLAGVPTAAAQSIDVIRMTYTAVLDHADGQDVSGLADAMLTINADFDATVPYEYWGQASNGDPILTTTAIAGSASITIDRADNPEPIEIAVDDHVVFTPWLSDSTNAEHGFAGLADESLYTIAFDNQQGISGTFFAVLLATESGSNAQEGDLPDAAHFGTEFSFTNAAMFINEGNDTSLYYFTQPSLRWDNVPTPSTVGLIAMGGVCAARRRR